MVVKTRQRDIFINDIDSENQDDYPNPIIVHQLSVYKCFLEEILIIFLLIIMIMDMVILIIIGQRTPVLHLLIIVIKISIKTA